MIKKILILGGGSGGVRCALNLEKKLKDKVLAGQAWLKYQFSPESYLRGLRNTAIGILITR